MLGILILVGGALLQLPLVTPPLLSSAEWLFWVNLDRWSWCSVGRALELAVLRNPVDNRSQRGEYRLLDGTSCLLAP